jgi:hypothetical protein
MWQLAAFVTPQADRPLTTTTKSTLNSSTGILTSGPTACVGLDPAAALSPPTTLRMKCGKAPCEFSIRSRLPSHCLHPFQKLDGCSFDQRATRIRGEFAAKRQEEVLERELMTMLTPVHVENSGPLLGSNRPIPAHFSPKKLLRSIPLQWIWPYSGSPTLALSHELHFLVSLRKSCGCKVSITSPIRYSQRSRE